MRRIQLNCSTCERIFSHVRVQNGDQLTMICDRCGLMTVYKSPSGIPLLERLQLAIHNAIQEVKPDYEGSFVK